MSSDLQFWCPNTYEEIIPNLDCGRDRDRVCCFLRAKTGDNCKHVGRHFHRSDDEKIDEEDVDEEGCGRDRGRVRFTERIAEEEEGGEEGSRNLSDGIAFGDRIAYRDALKLRRAQNSIRLRAALSWPRPVS